MTPSNKHNITPLSTAASDSSIVHAPSRSFASSSSSAVPGSEAAVGLASASPATTTASAPALAFDSAATDAVIPSRTPPQQQQPQPVVSATRTTLASGLPATATEANDINPVAALPPTTPQTRSALGSRASSPSSAASSSSSSLAVSEVTAGAASRTVTSPLTTSSPALVSTGVHLSTTSSSSSSSTLALSTDPTPSLSRHFRLGTHRTPQPQLHRQPPRQQHGNDSDAESDATTTTTTATTEQQPQQQLPQQHEKANGGLEADDESQMEEPTASITAVDTNPAAQAPTNEATPTFRMTSTSNHRNSSSAHPSSPSSSRSAPTLGFGQMDSHSSAQDYSPPALYPRKQTARKSSAGRVGPARRRGRPLHRHLQQSRSVPSASLSSHADTAASKTSARRSDRSSTRADTIASHSFIKQHVDPSRSALIDNSDMGRYDDTFGYQDRTNNKNNKRKQPPQQQQHSDDATAVASTAIMPSSSLSTIHAKSKHHNVAAHYATAHSEVGNRTSTKVDSKRRKPTSTPRSKSNKSTKDKDMKKSSKSNNPSSSYKTLQKPRSRSLISASSSLALFTSLPLSQASMSASNVTSSPSYSSSLIRTTHSGRKVIKPLAHYLNERMLPTAQGMTVVMRNRADSALANQWSCHNTLDLGISGGFMPKAPSLRMSASPAKRRRINTTASKRPQEATTSATTDNPRDGDDDDALRTPVPFRLVDFTAGSDNPDETEQRRLQTIHTSVRKKQTSKTIGKNTSKQDRSESGAESPSSSESNGSNGNRNSSSGSSTESDTDTDTDTDEDTPHLAKKKSKPAKPAKPAKASGSSFALSSVGAVGSATTMTTSGWTEDAVSLLNAAYVSMNPNTPNFWNLVAQSVGGGKTAAHCQIQYEQQFPTPKVVKRRKRVPAAGVRANKKNNNDEPDDGEQDEVDQEQDSDDDATATGRATTASSSTKSSASSTSSASFSSSFSSNTSTLAPPAPRPRSKASKLRQLIAAANRVHTDDLFDATPVKPTITSALTSTKVAPAAAAGTGLAGDVTALSMNGHSQPAGGAFNSALPSESSTTFSPTIVQLACSLPSPAPPTPDVVINAAAAAVALSSLSDEDLSPSVAATADHLSAGSAYPVNREGTDAYINKIKKLKHGPTSGKTRSKLPARLRATAAAGAGIATALSTHARKQKQRRATTQLHSKLLHHDDDEEQDSAEDNRIASEDESELELSDRD